MGELELRGCRATDGACRQDVKEAAVMAGKTETCRDAERRNQSSSSSSESGMMQEDRGRQVVKEAHWQVEVRARS